MKPFEFAEFQPSNAVSSAVTVLVAAWFLLAGGAMTALAGAGITASRIAAQEGHSPAVATPSGSDTPVSGSDFPLKTLLGMAPLGLMPALAGLMMIRCSGLLMGRWMFLPGWPGRRRSWRR